MVPGMMEARMATGIMEAGTVLRMVEAGMVIQMMETGMDSEKTEAIKIASSRVDILKVGEEMTAIIIALPGKASSRVEIRKIEEITATITTIPPDMVLRMKILDITTTRGFGAGTDNHQTTSLDRTGRTEMTDRHRTGSKVTENRRTEFLQCQTMSEITFRNVCRRNITGSRPTTYLCLCLYIYKANVRVASLTDYPLYLFNLAW